MTINLPITCPHCEANYDISRECAWHLYNDENEEDVKCPCCEKDFTVEKDVTWVFSARKTDEQQWEEWDKEQAK